MKRAFFKSRTSLEAEIISVVELITRGQNQSVPALLNSLKLDEVQEERCHLEMVVTKSSQAAISNTLACLANLC